MSTARERVCSGDGSHGETLSGRWMAVCGYEVCRINRLQVRGTCGPQERSPMGC